MSLSPARSSLNLDDQPLRMGFLTRETRLPDAKRLDNVPLTYIQGGLTSKPRPNFAPFSTTSKRELGEKEKEIPPPGRYELAGTLESKQTPAVAGFKSKTKRFVPEKPADAPGPGFYTLKTYINAGHPKERPKATIVKQAELGLTNELRSAPSIPTKFQAYGYENRDGKLVPQQPLKPGFSGLASDAVGPGDYDPPVKPMYKSQNAVFGKLTGRNESPVPGATSYREAATMPGPGYYNIQDASSAPVGEGFYDDGNYMLKLNESKKRMLSSFQSQTQREAPVPKDKLDPNLPGPGTYLLPPSTFIMKKSASTQCFSSTDSRFRDPVPRSQRIQTSPGTYSPVVSDFEINRIKILKKKRMAARSGWAQHVSFDATEARFMQLDKKVAPPPGTYDPKTTIADHLKHENPRAGPFGSKSKRFDLSSGSAPGDEGGYTGENTTAIGGVGSPSGIVNGPAPPGTSGRRSPTPNFKTDIISTAQVNNAIFASKSNRFVMSKNEIPVGPPPGTYNVAPKWDTAKGVLPINAPKTESLLNKPPELPGPGYYDYTKETRNDRAKRRNRKNVMFTSDARLLGDISLQKYYYGPHIKGTGPGPQDYDANPNSLVKPSFNALMNPNQYY